MESSSDGSSSLGAARRMDSDVEKMTAKHVWNREDIVFTTALSELMKL